MLSSYQQQDHESSKLIPRVGEFEEMQEDVSVVSRASADMSKAASTKSFRILLLLFGVLSIMFATSPSAISIDNPSTLRSQSSISSLDIYGAPWTCPEGSTNADGYCSICCPVASCGPTATPSLSPSELPTADPSERPSVLPTVLPTELPTEAPTTANPSFVPSPAPTVMPTTSGPTKQPSFQPSILPTFSPTSATIVGLIHRYSFNDGTASDSVGGMDAALQGKAYTANGRLILNNPAAASYVQLPPNVLGSTTDISLEFWTSTGVLSGSVFPVLFQIGASLITNGNSLIIDRNGGTGLINAYIYTSPAFYVSSSISFFSLPETHIVYTISKSGTVNTLTLYINGQKSVSGTTYAAIPSSAAGGYLGKSFYAADPNMNGTINEFRVWSYALSAAQVAQNYNSGPDSIAI